MKFSIVLIPFPFDDFQSEKVRPALCLTHPISIHQHIILAAITSNIKNATEKSDFLLMRDMSEFSKTGLKTDSVIKLHRLITARQIHFQKTIGELPSLYQLPVTEKLHEIFSL